jgi:tripartite-type tricarboxylate transporter receptor subunit TctC
LLLAATVVAQTYPAKPIRVIVPHPPATPDDLAVRVFGDRLPVR